MSLRFCLIWSYLNASLLSCSHTDFSYISSLWLHACVIIRRFWIFVLIFLLGYFFVFFFVLFCFVAICTLLEAVMVPSHTSHILYQLKTHRCGPTEVKQQTLPKRPWEFSSVFSFFFMEKWELICLFWPLGLGLQVPAFNLVSLKINAHAWILFNSNAQNLKLIIFLWWSISEIFVLQIKY